GPESVAGLPFVHPDWHREECARWQWPSGAPSTIDRWCAGNARVHRRQDLPCREKRAPPVAARQRVTLVMVGIATGAQALRTADGGQPEQGDAARRALKSTARWPWNNCAATMPGSPPARRSRAMWCHMVIDALGSMAQ